MIMNKTLLAATFICAVATVSLSESAWAKAQAVAVWSTGQNSSTPEIIGNGRDNAEALENARAQCRNLFIGSSTAGYCANNPVRLSYSIIPEGTYSITCGKCGVSKQPEGEILVCSHCKPVMQQRRLNLSQCPVETRDKIENCHGELICGVCP